MSEERRESKRDGAKPTSTSFIKHSNEKKKKNKWKTKTKTKIEWAQGHFEMPLLSTFTSPSSSGKLSYTCVTSFDEMKHIITFVVCLFLSYTNKNKIKYRIKEIISYTHIQFMQSNVNVTEYFFFFFIIFVFHFDWWRLSMLLLWLYLASLRIYAAGNILNYSFYQLFLFLVELTTKIFNENKNIRNNQQQQK